MEWDEVETNGLLQPFETSVMSALVELRQRHWKECTNLINNFESGLSRVNAEKADLVKYALIHFSTSASLDSSANDLTPVAAPAFLHRRPSGKRLCLATTNGQLAVNIARTESNEVNGESKVLVAETQNDLPPGNS
ncbi:unnamed protein product [Hydatigera taeniaeformis]|uniref:Nuclear pore complex protein n=1 Tax=Hydatigena taeniaeformis TaxID=6205 RepID=A0A0R3WVJ7_HYDTA|nr:unnamed protein product [Hydatigera taeniaeformis]